MIKNVVLTLGSFWLACSISLAQLTYIVQPTLRPKFSTGVHGQGFFTDASLCVRWRSEPKGGFPSFTQESLLLGAGIEHNYKFRKDFRLIPKIILEYGAMNSGLMLRLQNRFCPAKDLDFSNVSWQVCPEIGVNLFHVFSISYGYSFALTSAKAVPSLGHQVCLSFNFIMND